MCVFVVLSKVFNTTVYNILLNCFLWVFTFLLTNASNSYLFGRVQTIDADGFKSILLIKVLLSDQA